MISVLCFLQLGCASTNPADPSEESVDSVARTDSAPLDETGIDLPDCGSAWVDVDIGAAPTCGIREGGCVECWSEEPFAQDLIDAVPNARFAEISVRDYWDTSWGGGLICGIGLEGRTFCWPEYPPDPPITGEFTTIRLGDATSCGITSDGRLVCDDRSSGAFEKSGPFMAVDVSPNEDGWCAAPTAGGLVCEDGAVDGLDGAFVQISYGGSREGCALRDDGVAVCWSPRTGPVEIEAADGLDVLAVAYLSQSIVLLRSDGTLEGVAWKGDIPDLPSGLFAAIDDCGVGMCAVELEGADIHCFARNGIPLPGPP